MAACFSLFTGLCLASVWKCEGRWICLSCAGSHAACGLGVPAWGRRTRRCFPAGGKLQGTRLKMDFGFVEQAVCKQMHLDSVLAFSRYTVFALFLIKMDGKYWGCSLGFAIIAINILNSALVNSQKDKWEGSHQVGSQVETLCLRLL